MPPQNVFMQVHAMYTNCDDTAKAHVHITTQLQKYKGSRELFVVIDHVYNAAQSLHPQEELPPT